MLDLFITMFIPAIALMLKPGPHFVAMISMAAAGRWRSMLIFWASATIASTINYFVLLGGLSFIPEDVGYIFIFIKLAAAMFFVSMGANSLANAHKVKLESFALEKEELTLQKFMNNIFSGALTSLSNPFVIIFILTAIPAIVGKTDFSFLEIGVIRSAVIFADIAVLAIFITPILFFRNIVNTKVLVVLKYLSGVAMIGIGVFIAFSMITQWDLYKADLFG